MVGESITIKFKSDRSCLSDKDLMATIVSLANTDGGHLFLGVEDDGEKTGVCAKHNQATSLSAFTLIRNFPIANRQYS